MQHFLFSRTITIIVVFCGLAIPAQITAELVYEGSSTIGEGIMQEAAAAFTTETGIRFKNIGLLGSGKGFLAVTEGRASLAGISRPLNNEEKKGAIYYQIIGYDAIVLYVNSANRVKHLTRDQVKGIFSGAIKNWRYVGGIDQPILVVTEILAGKRATIEEFKQLAMDGIAYGPSKEIDKPHDCVEFVSKNANAITFATIAFSMKGTANVIYDGSEPSLKNISSGAYPLSRPLILISRGYPKDDLKKFYSFMLSEIGQKIVSKKFVPVRR